MVTRRQKRSANSSSKEEMLRLRITAADKRLLESAAEMEHDTVSNWVRRVAIKEAERLARTVAVASQR